jgi:4-diphosphocytidyl-2-C-methyl-D-erythritol kinase
VTDELRLRAFAKVNYALEVGERRDDGYHEISSILQNISLADEVEIERSKGSFELRIEPEGAELGSFEQNTVYRAWRLLCRLAGSELPVRIRLHKKIPAQAGLGGGSADAAATLCGLNQLFSLGLSHEDLRRLGSSIGSDVPFALTGGAALAEGVGEMLTALPPPPLHRLLVAKPERGADTAGIYRAYDEWLGGEGMPSVEGVVEGVVAALRTGVLPALARSLGNDLEPITAGFVPEVRWYREDLLRLGAMGAAMSGTGTAVYGVFEGEDEAWSVAERFHAPYVGIFEPVLRGVEVL